MTLAGPRTTNTRRDHHGVINGGTLAGTGTVLGNTALTGTGIINFSAGGQIANTLAATGGNWNGVGTVTGDVNVTSGTLSIGSGANLTTNGTVNVSGTAGISAVAANSTITGNVNLTSTANITFAGVIAGTNSTVTVNNPNPGGNTGFFLSGTNTYGGLTTVSGGFLVLSNPSALGANGGGAPAQGTVVQVGGALALQGIAVGNEALTINGAGNTNFTGALAPAAALVGAGSSSWAGPITLGSNATIGVLPGGSTLTLSGGIDKSGRVLTFATTSSAGAAGTITITTNGITGAAANSDLVVDSVTVNENVANTYNGPTFIRSTLLANTGRLNANVADALPTANGRSAVTLDDAGLGGSRLNLGANQSIASLTGAASSLVNLSATGVNTLTIGTAAGATNFAGVISGAGSGASLIKDGASVQILSGNNTYGGTTTVLAGTLQTNVSDAIPAASAVTINPATGATGGTLNVNGAGVTQNVPSLTINAPTAASTAVTGTGTLALNGTLSLVNNTTSAGSGAATTINVATLALGGANRTISVQGQNASPGDLRISSAITGTGGYTISAPASTSGGGIATVVLEGSAVNTNNGAVTVNTGNLLLNRTTANGTIAGNIVIGDGIADPVSGTLANSARVTLAIIGQIANSSDMTINADGQFNMSGIGEAINNLTINSGNVINVPTAGGFTDLGLVSNLAMTGGSINGGLGATNGLSLFGPTSSVTATSDAAGAAAINSNVTLFATNRTFTVNRGPAAQDLIINGVVQNGAVAGSVSITKAGAGFMQLSGLNTYTGQTLVTDGKLTVTQSTSGNFSALGFGDNTLPQGTIVDATAQPAKLVLNNGVSITNEFLQLKNGGQLQMGTPGGSATWGGTIQIVGGPGVLDALGGTLNVGSIDKTDTNLTLTDSLNSPKGVATINIGGAITGNTVLFNDDLFVTGVTTNLNAANTYLGPTHISSTVTGGGVGGGNGVLNANVAAALPVAAGRTAVDMDQTGVGGSTLNIGGTLAFPAGANQAIASIVGAANSSVTLGGNTLTIGFGTAPNTNGTAGAVFAGVISGTGGILKDDTSTQILIGANTYLGQTRVNGGTLQIGDGATAGASIASSVPVIVDAAGVLAINLVNNGTFTNNVTNNGIVRGINTTPNTQTISGVISGAGSFQQNVSGTTVFTNINTYQGGTVIGNGTNVPANAPTLRVGTGAQQGSVGTGIVTFNSRGTLHLVNVNGDVFPNNVTNTSAGLGQVLSTPAAAVTITITGALTSAGAGQDLALVHQAPGTTILTNPANNFSDSGSFGNDVDVEQGTLQIGTIASPSMAGPNTAGRFITVGINGTLALVNLAGNTLNSSINNFFGAAGTVNVNSLNNNTLSGPITATSGTIQLRQTGSGTTTLTSATNNINGGTTVSAGGLTIGTGALPSRFDTAGTSSVSVGTGGTLTLVNLVGNAQANNIGNTLGGAGSVIVNSLNNNTLSGILSNAAGTLSLTQSGAGTTILTGANTYTGATLVSGGTLQVGNGTIGSLNGASAVTVNAGAFLDINLANNGIFANNVANSGTVRGINTVGNTQTVSGIISGTGNFLQSVSGTTVFTANNTYQGGTVIGNGTNVNRPGLQVGSAAQQGSVGTGNVTFNGGGNLMLVNVDGGVFANNVSNPTVGNGVFQINTAAGVTTTITGAITSAGGGQNIHFWHTGAGTTILTNANNIFTSQFGENTHVQAGTLQIGTAGSPSLAGANVAGRNIDVDFGATLNLVNIVGNVLNNNLFNPFGGTATVNVNSLNNNTLAGSITAAAGTITLNQIGSGTTTLTNAANAINGGVTVSDGGLTIGTGALPSRIDAAGTATVNVGTGGVLTLVNLVGNAMANNISNGIGGAGLVNVNSGNNNTLSGILSNGATGTLALTQSGNGTTLLTGANTYTGTTNVNAGTLQVGNNTSGNIQSPQINVLGGATFGVNLATGATLPGNIANGGTINANIAAGTQTLGGIITGNGIFNHTGAGTTNLTGISTYTGATTISAGTLLVNGALGNTAVNVQTGGTLGGNGSIGGIVTVQNGGTIAAGNSPGTLTVAGLVLNAASNSTFELGVPGVVGQASLPGNDLIQVNGNLTLAGNLNVTPIASFGPGSYRLFNYTGVLTPNATTVNGVVGPLTAQVYLGVTGQVNLLVLNPAVIGAVQYWDGAGPANDNVIAGGSGTWDGFQNNWTTNTGAVNSAWQNGVANFGAAAGTVTLASTVNAQGLVFASNGYQINGAGAFTLNLVAGPAPVPFITVSPGLTATINAQITGANGLTADGAGTLVLTNTGNSFTGGVAITNGTVSVSSDSNLGNSANALALNNGTLQTTATFGSARGVTVAGNGTFDVTNANTFTASGIIGGAGSLTKSNTGTLVLSGANTYAGPTNILDGTVRVATNGNLGAVAGGITFGGTAGSNAILQTTGAVTFGNRGVTLNTGGGTVDTNGFNSSLAGVVTGAAGNPLNKTGAGTLTLTGASTYLGQTNVNGGTLQVGDGSSAATMIGNGAAVVVVNSGAALGINLANGGIFANPVTVNGGGSVIANNTAGTQTVSGVVSGAGTVSQTGAGTTVLTATNTYTGATTVSAGTLQIGDGVAANASIANSVSTTVNGGATLAIQLLNGEAFINSVTDNGAVVGLNTAGNTQTLSGVISGAGTLTQQGAGTTILTGNNTYGGTTTIAAGTLQIGNGGVSGTLGSGNVVDNGALIFRRSDTITVANLISGTGTLSQQGTGLTILTNTNTYSGATTVTNGTLQIGNGTTVGSSIANSASTTVNAGAALAINLANGETFVNNVTDNGAVNGISSGTQTLSGVISGSGTLNQNGTGTMILTGANTYSGVTTITAGTLQIGAGGASGSLGTGNVTDNGLLVFNRSDVITVGNLISGTGALRQQGAGTTILTGANTYSGTTTVVAGTLQIGDGATAGASIANSVSTTVNAGAALAINLANGETFTNSVTDNGAVNGVNTGANVQTLSGAISGAGTLNQTGTGTTILTGANTYGGTTTIAAGTLQIGNGGTVGTLGSGNVVDNGALVFNRSNLMTVANLISGTGTVTQQGTGTTILTATNTYSGATTVVFGTLQIGDGATPNASIANSAVTVNPGATLAINLANGETFVNNVADNGAVNGISANTQTLSGVISGAGTLNQNGTGRTILTGNNTYTGATTINAGTLQVGAGGTSGTLGNGGPVVDNGALVFDRSDTITVANVISGTGTLTQQGAGTSILTGANTYIGVTNVNNGTLQVGDGTSGNIQSGQINVVNGATFALNLANTGTLPGNIANNGTINSISANTQTFAGSITGTGVFNQTGTGLTILTGASTYTGATTVVNGNLRVNGSLGNTAVTVQNGATLSGTGSIAGTVTILAGGNLNPGTSPGTITTGTLVLNAGSNSNFELGTPGVIGQQVLPGNDLVNVNGNLTLDGNLNVTQLAGFGSGSYRLFNYTGTLTDNTVDTINGVGGAFTPVVVTAVANQVNLLVLANNAGPVQFWDGTGPANDGNINGGTGNWNNFSTNWTNAGGNPNASWQNGTAIFLAPAGTVTITETVNAQGLIFGANGYVINGSGGGTLNLVGQNPAVVGVPSISVTNAGDTATINAQITNSVPGFPVFTNGLVSTGAGRLVLANIGNTYTGGTTITGGGTVSISNDQNLGAIPGATGINDITLNNGVLQATATFTLNSNRSIILAGNGGIDVTGPDRLTYGGVVSGAGALSKTGTGILTLSGVNTYAGGTLILGGTLEISNDNNLGNVAGNITFGNGATLKTLAGINSARGISLDGGAGGGGVIDTNGFDSTLTGIITGAAGNGLVKNGAGILTVTGASTYLGTTTINAGTLQVGDNATAGAQIGNNGANVIVNGGAILDVRLTNGGTFNNPINTALGATINSTNNAGATQTFGGVISGAGVFNQNGLGTAVLNGANTYTGQTNVNAGTVVLGNATALGTIAAGTVVANGATLDLNGQTVGGEALTIGGAGVGGNGALINGNINVAASLAGAVTLTADTTITTNSANANATSGGSITLSGNVSGGFGIIKNGTGTLTLTGLNIYTGQTLVNAGILQAGNNFALGSVGANTVVANGASLQILNNVAVVGEPVVINGFGAGVAAPGALTQQLNGSSSLAGPVTVATNANISTNGTGTMTLTGGINKNGTTLTLNGGGTVNINSVGISGATSFTSDLVVDGTGVGGATIVNLNAASSYAGPTWITNGGTINANVVGALPAPAADGGIGTIRTTVIMDPTAAIPGTPPSPFPSTGGSALNLGANQAIQSLTGAVSSLVNLNTSTLTIGTALGGTTTFAGVISGANPAGASIVKDGTSTQIFGGPGSAGNTYTGSTTVIGGTLQAGVANTAFGVNSATTVGTAATVGNATLELTGFSNTIGSLAGTAAGIVQSTGGVATLTTGALNTNTDYAGVLLDGAGGQLLLVKNGTGTQTLSGPASNTYTGLTTVNGGELDLNKSGGSIAVGGNLTIGDGSAPGANSDIVKLLASQQIIDTSVVLINGTSGRLDLNNFNETIASIGDTGVVTPNGSSVTLGTGTLTLSAAAGTATFSGIISGANPAGASIVKTGASTQIFAGPNTYTGSTTVNGGTLQAGIITNAFGNNSAVTIGAAGTLELAGFSNTIGSLAGSAGAIVQSTGGAATLTTGALNTNTDYSGVLQNGAGGTLSLVKNGTGIQTLSGPASNTYTGLTTVNAGELDLNKTGGSIAVGGNLTIGDGAGGANSDIVKLLGSNQINPTSLVLINGTSGRLDLNNNSQTVGSIADTGVVTLNGSSINLGSGTLTTGAGGGANPANPSTAFSGVISGAGGNLVKAGSGTFTLNGINTYTGTTNVTGTLKAGSTQAFGINSAVTVNATGILDLAGNSNTIGSLTGPAGAFVRSSTGAATLTTGALGTSTNFAGIIQDNAGPLSLVKNGAGTQTLSGLNTYTGTTTVNAGSLLAGSTSAFGVNSAVTVNSGGTLDLGGFSNTIGSLSGVAGGIVQNSTGAPATLTTGGLNTSTTFGGTIQNGPGAPLAFVKNGTGTQVLTGTNSFTGGLTMNAGTLIAGSAKAFGSGNLTMTAGTIRTNGSPLVVNIANGNILFAGGTYIANVGGTVPGVQHDQLVTTGTANVGGGTLAIVQQNGFQLSPGAKVTLISATGGVAGGTASGTALPSGNVTGLAAFSSTPLLVPTVNLYTTSVVLEAMQGSFAGLKGVLDFTPNQLAVANALDSLQKVTGGKTGVLSELNFLDTQSLTTLKGNLDKIAPEELASIFDISTSLSKTQNRNLQQSPS